MRKMIGMLVVMILGASLSFAQTADNANSDRGTGTATTQNGDDNNQGHNWGWIGLLGLAGLGGLRGRKQSSTERDRDVTNIRRAA
jgi:MYXO-CTERM domain-containing protein